jgi:hypothetical protein
MSLSPPSPPSSSTIPYPIQETPFGNAPPPPTLDSNRKSNRSVRSTTTNKSNNTSIFSDDDDLLTQPDFLEGWEAPSPSKAEKRGGRRRGQSPEKVAAKRTKAQEKAAAKEAKAQEKAFERARKKRLQVRKAIQDGERRKCPEYEAHD